jgi:hypothetical protein
METLPKTKSELMQQLNQSWKKLEKVLEPLSDEQITTRHDQVGWSIKDHLDHLAVWEEGVAALLERKPRQAAMGLDAADEKDLHDETKFDDQNAKIRERTKSRSLAQTRAALHASREHLERALGPLKDADLFKSYSYYQPDEHFDDSGNPVIGWIVGNSSGHYLEHLPWIEAIASSR